MPRAKKKPTTINLDASPTPVPSPEETPTKLPPHVFLTRYACPRCSSWQTLRTGQDGPIQYRKCTMPTCRHAFKVTALSPKETTA